jgi:hypothetical protein
MGVDAIEIRPDIGAGNSDIRASFSHTGAISADIRQRESGIRARTSYNRFTESHNSFSAFDSGFYSSDIGVTIPYIRIGACRIHSGPSDILPTDSRNRAIASGAAETNAREEETSSLSQEITSGLLETVPGRAERAFRPEVSISRRQELHAELEVATSRPEEITARGEETNADMEEIATYSREIDADIEEILFKQLFLNHLRIWGPFFAGFQSKHRKQQPETQMNSRIATQLNMVGACINVAEGSDYVDIWTGKEPAGFGTDLANLKTSYGLATSTAAAANGASGGAMDAKTAAETALEDEAYILARALALHFKKTGDLDLRGKVDYNRSGIQKLSNVKLVACAAEIRDLANSARSDPAAANCGVNANRISALDTAIAVYQNVMSKPRGQIVNRSTLLKEVETLVADMMEQLHDLDDLVLQFDSSDAGEQFIKAWKHARMILDSGHGKSSDAPPEPDPVPAPPAATTTNN